MHEEMKYLSSFPIMFQSNHVACNDLYIRTTVYATLPPLLMMNKILKTLNFAMCSSFISNRQPTPALVEKVKVEYLKLQNCVTSNFVICLRFLCTRINVY